MENRSTPTRSKRLLCLITALILACSAMSIGGTIAWFTDEVTSAGNIISTGNLKVELRHSNPADTQELVTKEIKLFDAMTSPLWEPGVVTYENFTIHNGGNLALKYQMALKVDQQSFVNSHYLSEAIRYAVIRGGVSGSRSDVLGAVDAAQWKPLSQFNINEITGNLIPGQPDDIWGVVLYWLPSAEDNLFNMKNELAGNQLNLQVSVHLSATQMSHEQDAFGSDYDQGTAFEQQATVQTAENGSFSYTNADGSLIVNGEAGDQINAVSISVESTVPSAIAMNGMHEDQSVDSYDIHVEGMAEKTLVQLAMQIQPGLNNIEIYHEDILMMQADLPLTMANTFHYAPDTGVLSLCVGDFSSFHFVYDKPGYSGDNEKIKIGNQLGGYLKVTDNSEALRESAAGSNKKDHYVTVGAVLPYYGRPVQIGAYTWYYVKDGNHKGYLRGDQAVQSDEQGVPLPIQYAPLSDFEWENHGTYIRITKYIGAAADVVVPETIEGLPVTVLGINTFAALPFLKTVELPSTLTSIENVTFIGCPNLVSVNIPKNVRHIGDGAFYECTNLSSIVIPDGVESIGSSAFNSCKSLQYAVIPESVDYFGDNAFVRCEVLESIFIPEGVLTIGTDTFRDCRRLKTLSLPSTLKTIGDSAFSGCRRLEKVSLPNSIETMGIHVFEYCDLKNFTLPSKITQIPQGLLMGNENLKNVTLHNRVSIIEFNVFNGCSALKKIDLPDSVNEIWAWAFMDCTSLKDISLPSGITTLGQEAFRNCPSLTSLILPPSLYNVGEYVFHDCPHLILKVYVDSNLNGYCEYFGYPYAVINAAGQVIATPNPNVTPQPMNTPVPNPDPTPSPSIFPYEFDVTRGEVTIRNYLGNDVNVTVPSAIAGIPVTQIQQNAFSGNNNLQSITIHDAIYFIANGVFKNSVNLQSVHLPPVMSAFAPQTFQGCVNLKNITLPRGISDLPVEFFEGCASLQSITIPDTVSIINDKAFANCCSLAEITLPESVTTLRDKAFTGCENLKTVYLPSSLTFFGENVFENCHANLVVWVYENSQAHQYCQAKGITTKLRTDAITTPAPSPRPNHPSYHYPPITIPSPAPTNAPNMADFPNPNVWSGSAQLNSYTGKSTSDLVVPDYVNGQPVTQLSGSLFSDHLELKTVELPMHLRSISQYLFGECQNITNIVIPESVTEIEAIAFSNCRGLTSLYLPDGIKYIGNEAFANCRNLKSLDLPANLLFIGETAFRDCGELTSITLPEGLTGINNNAFQNCQSLSEITLPSTLTFIGADLFKGCNPQLRIYVYQGSYAHQWCDTNDINYTLIQ